MDILPVHKALNAREKKDEWIQYGPQPMALKGLQAFLGMGNFSCNFPYISRPFID